MFYSVDQIIRFVHYSINQIIWSDHYSVKLVFGCSGFNLDIYIYIYQGCNLQPNS